MNVGVVGWKEEPRYIPQIVVLKKGELQEVGSYENLMALNGEFGRLRKLYHNITKEYVTNGHAVSDTTSLKLIQIRPKCTVT